MALYVYRCAQCGDVEIRHPFSAVNDEHICPACGQVLRRVLTPTHHRWPSQFFPGNEESGQRQLLDPEFQARKRDEFDQRKAEHARRTGGE